jgi:hypothetical protein
MRTLLVSAALLFAIACGSKPGATGAKGPPPNAADRDTCTTADDCTLVEACCGCTAGGKRVAIRKDAVAEYDATRPQRCGDSQCPQVISTHSSCNAEATCDAGHCKVMAHMGDDDGAPPSEDPCAGGE